jgi:hypothetical protein
MMPWFNYNGGIEFTFIQAIIIGVVWVGGIMFIAWLIKRRRERQ